MEHITAEGTQFDMYHDFQESKSGENQDLNVAIAYTSRDLCQDTRGYISHDMMCITMNKSHYINPYTQVTL